MTSFLIVQKLSKKEVIKREKEIFDGLKKKCDKCPKCGRKNNLTLDHIIPKRILLQFGIDPGNAIVEDNYQILCRVCNIFKGDKLDFSNPATKVLLIELLEFV